MYLCLLYPDSPFSRANRALCTSFARSFSQVLAIRWFLGVFESAVLPSVVYCIPMITSESSLKQFQVFYLSTFYKRNELASRIGVFYGDLTVLCFARVIYRIL
jgi:hypothetical protein